MILSSILQVTLEAFITILDVTFRVFVIECAKFGPFRLERNHFFDLQNRTENGTVFWSCRAKYYMLYS